jgi:hypothetical protein
MDMFQQAKIAKTVIKVFKEYNKSIRHYLSLKNTENINRSALARVVRDLRTEKYNHLKKSNELFPTVNYISIYANH